MAFHRDIDPSESHGDSLDAVPALREQRIARSSVIAAGTLACPECDAPVVPPAGGAAPSEPLGCPYCGHDAHVRDFLSLAPPSRPARVVVRVVAGPKTLRIARR